MTNPIVARSFWVVAPGRGELREETLPPPSDPPPEGGEVLVRARWSGISRGTEALVFRGEVPASQAEAMRAPFQAGPFPAPVKYGYASVGMVEEASGGDEALALVGRTVLALHPHQDRYRIPARAALPVPEGVPAERAVLAPNLETAVNVAWDAGPLPGDRIVVVGAGVVGLLAGWLCNRIPGCEVTLVDVDPERAEVCTALGLAFTTDPGRAVAPGSADLVIHASGNPQGLVSALPLAGDEGTVVEASWFGTRSVPLPLGEDFHRRRLVLRSSQVGRIPPHRAARWTHRRRLELALRLLEAPELDLLLTDEIPFEALPEAMPRIASGTTGSLCDRVRYPQG